MAEVSLPKSRPKNAAAIVKRDLKESKLKVPEISEETKKHRDQMALLEIRAELDPYLMDNDAARLGFDIIERGVEVDGKSGGELLAMIASGEEGLYNYNFGNRFFGAALPSDRLSQTPHNGRTMTTTEFPKRKISTNTTKVLQNQGIKSLLPASEGSTVYYETGYTKDPEGKGFTENYPSDQGLSVLMEELAHIGVRYAQNEMDEMKTGAYDAPFDIREEERVMDVMQERSADKRGVYSEAGNSTFYSPSSIPMQNMKKLDEVSSKALRQRGVPPTAKRIEPGIMESILGMFK